MARPNTVKSIATVVCLVGTSCQAILGTVDVTPAPQAPVQTPGSVDVAPPPVQGGATGSPPPLGGGGSDFPAGDPVLGGGLPVLDAGPPSSPGQGTIDAGPPPPSVRPVVVGGAVTELERVGVDGGEPRLGVCQNGVVVGIRPTANPSEEVFGQRLTFIEPICARVDAVPGQIVADPSSAIVTLVRDESMLDWDDTGDFQGAPSTEVPDPRLIWEVQPVTLCPDTAPVLVGMSGEYEPTAPDAADSAVIRSMVIECAPLVVASNGIDIVAADSGHQFISQADSFAASGTAVYRSACEGGAVATQIQVSAGYWLDGFVLGCSSLRIP